MLSYLALNWNPRDTIQARSARQLADRLPRSLPEMRSVYGSKGMQVFCAGMRAGSSQSYLLSGGRGVVLGKMFHQDVAVGGPDIHVALGEADSLQIVKGGGQGLIDRYWGRYIAMLRSKDGEDHFVIRSPAGALPCFVTSAGGVNIAFSLMEECLSLGVQSPSINWHHVAAVLAYPFVHNHETGIEGVTELLPGERLRLPCTDAVRDRRAIWDPVAIAKSTPLEEMDEAVASARETVQQCVSAWASCHSTIIHKLSGGLDSAVILSCLERAPTRPQVTCLNYFDRSVEGDERATARIAAAHFGHGLIEQENDPSLVSLEPLLALPRSPLPSVMMYYLINSRREIELARERCASAISGGAGGDQLFNQDGIGLSAVDYAHRYGIGPRLFSISLDVAHATNRSIWNVLREAIYKGFLNRRCDVLSKVGQLREFVSADVLSNSSRDRRLIHPLLGDAPGVAHGKYQHLLGLMTTPPYYDPLNLPGRPDPLEPMMSQPLIELSLRIPTYQHNALSHDRTIERRAFIDDLPLAILRRLDKGGSTDFLTQMLRHHEPFVREMLLDGTLVKERLLDRRKLEAFLSGNYHGSSARAAEIVDECLSMEAWCMSWQGTKRRAAA